MKVDGDIWCVDRCRSEGLIQVEQEWEVEGVLRAVVGVCYLRHVGLGLRVVLFELWRLRLSLLSHGLLLLRELLSLLFELPLLSLHPELPQWRLLLLMLVLGLLLFELLLLVLLRDLLPLQGGKGEVLQLLRRELMQIVSDGGNECEGCSCSQVCWCW